MRRLPFTLATVLLIGLSCLIFPFELNRAKAQTPNADPKTEGVAVSAAVPDYFPPTTPVLISPADGAILTDGYLTFIWQGSTDVNGIKEYKLFLDGQLYLDYLPTHSTSNDDYELVYDNSNHHYQLTLKKRLADGLHTWKVRVNDSFSNSSDSATWSFTVDTQAPNFVLTQVGEQTTSISAQDLSTVPTEPLVLTENEPQLLGHGETNSTVELTVTIPGETAKVLVNTTDVNGNWGEKLGILPRDELIQLDFTITDSAGLISVLNGVQFIIKQKTITYPPSSPAPTITAGVSPSPGFSPQPSPVSISPQPSPLISIPLTPPIEIAHEIIQEGFKRLPQSIQNLIRAIPAPTRQYLTARSRQVSPILAPLILILVGLLAPLAILKRFGRRLSPHLLWRGLQALGLLPTGLPAAPPQGLVYDSDHQAPLAYAEIELYQDNQLVNVVLTDEAGIYRGLNCQSLKAEHSYHLRVELPGYRFPTNQNQPPHLTPDQFYRGEAFTLDSLSQTADDWNQSKYPALKLIPLDHYQDRSADYSTGSGWTRFFWALILDMRQVKKLYHWLLLPLFIILGLITIIFPTPINLATFAFYLVFVVRHTLEWFAVPNLQGQVVAPAGLNVVGTIIELFQTDETDEVARRYISLMQADEQAQFTTRLKNGQYYWRATHLSAVTEGIEPGQNQDITNLPIISMDEGQQTLVVALEPLTI